MSKTSKIIAEILFGAIALTVILCFIFKIHIFTFDIKNEYVSRVECIDGYYVAVYEQTVCGYTENGQQNISIGNCSRITDYSWKHEEMLGIVPYRRFLCFSKETEPQIYYLESEDGSLTYGLMFVLRMPKGDIRYYFRRGYDFALNMMQETVSFESGGMTFSLENYCSFVSDIDFTAGDRTFYINGEPCRFSAD